MKQPVGVFDSGIGGLCVWREIVRQLPRESTVYLADQAHLPYGPRPAAEVRALAEAATAELLERGCKAIVVACNTASAAALKSLRERHPDVPFVGMEPAVKPAALHSRSRVVGVMATPGTLQGGPFAELLQRFATGVKVVQQPCPGLVERIERGEADAPGTEALLRELMAPMLAAGADVVVLACTHYPFALPLIQRIAGDGVRIIDPAPAVARQLGRVLEERGLRAEPDGQPSHRFLTSGNPEALRRALRTLLEVDAPVEAWEEKAAGVTP
jgi:glutamate racemase